MKTIQSIIVEDEAPSRERLKSLLAEIPDIKLIGEAGNTVFEIGRTYLAGVRLRLKF